MSDLERPDMAGAAQAIQAAKDAYPNDPTGVVVNAQAAEAKMGEAEVYPMAQSAWTRFTASIAAIEEAATGLETDWDGMEAGLDEVEAAFSDLVDAVTVVEAGDGRAEAASER